MGPGFESLKVHQWPIGQVVKTAASHAVNIGSNPVWVTRNQSPKGVDINDGYIRPYEFVLIVMWVHLFPSRTQKLSTCTPTIVAGRLAVKIGNANIKPRSKGRGFFLPASVHWTLADGRTIVSLTVKKYRISIFEYKKQPQFML